MSAIIKMVVDGARVWLILDCGHWYKWTGKSRPAADEDFRCPNCHVVSVKAGAGSDAA